MVTKNWSRKHPKFSIFSWTIAEKETHQSFKVFTWLTFQKLKTCCNSISSFVTLTLWMENWLVSSAGEVFKSMKKVSSFYATTITFATSTTSTHCSKLSGVLRVTHFSQRRGIWNDIWLLVVIVLNIFTQRMITNWEKRFLKSWMHTISHIKTSKNCSWTWQYLTLSPFVSGKTLTSKLRLQHGSGSMFLYQFLCHQTWSRNPFFCNANLLHLILSFITALEGLATQSKAQMKLNFIEVETGIKIKLCYTGTTLPKTQTSREGVIF